MQGNYEPFRHHVMLKVDIEYRSVPCMIDTGATANLISEKLVRELHTFQYIDRCQLPVFVGANGKPLDVLGAVVFPFEFSGSFLFHRWYIVRDLPIQLLMGNEMLRLHHASIDYDGEMV